MDYKNWIIGLLASIIILLIAIFVQLSMIRSALDPGYHLEEPAQYQNLPNYTNSQTIHF